MQSHVSLRETFQPIRDQPEYTTPTMGRSLVGVVFVA
jgi:hypothetical protein